MKRTLIMIAMSWALGLDAQQFPEPSFTLKGMLTLPVPVTSDLFSDITESIGGLDLAVQYPFLKGLSAGVGGKAIWFGLEERSFAPQRVSGEIFRSTYFGKLAYESYTGQRSFYEISAKAGYTDYRIRASSCPDDQVVGGFHWSGQFSYYLHATDNLAFGLMVGYEQDAARMAPELFCLETFPGRSPEPETRDLGYFSFGLCFSTRFRKAADTGRDW
ncbi:MAG: hypothetical protein KDB88_00335 [Flavobacteriales bacterium]|nr:hypothetical protein [Flavobacteriales bacterium]